MTPAQCRAARALLDISRPDLARMSGVSLRSIEYFEAGEREPLPHTLAALSSALEKAGVSFISENGGGGAGVRWAAKGRRRR